MSESLLTLTELDSGSVFTLHPADQFLVVLNGNPTTGYQWLVSTFSAKVLRQTVEPAYQPGSDLSGSGGSFRFLFKAVGPGETTLRLAYRRPFEVGKKPLMRFKVVVRVIQADDVLLEERDL